MRITARGTFNGRELVDIPVVNPGNFGRTWLVEIGGSVEPLFLIVEAGGVSGVIDELADSEEHGHHIIVADENLSDYDYESCHYAANGKIVDTDWLMIHGDEGAKEPFPCRYFGDGLPVEGIEPRELQDYDLGE